MNITELKKDSISFQVKVIVSVEELTAEVEKKLTEISKTAKMDGFRVGKVPHLVLRKKYYTALKADVIENKISRATDDIAKENKLGVVIKTEVLNFVNEENKDLEFILKYHLLPEIKIPDFKEISLEKPVLEINDKDVELETKKLLHLAKDYAKESKAKTKIGDRVTIDAIGYVNGKEFAGGKLNAHKLVLGSGVFIPGFEDQLVGYKAGNEVLVKVNFPQKYHEKSLAGKAAEFKTKILAVHTETEAKLDDTFAKKLNFENLEKLKERVLDNMHAAYDEPIETMMKMELFDKLEGVMDFEVPSVILEGEVNTLKQQLLQAGDIDLEGKSIEEQDYYLTRLAKRRVRLGLMLAEYVKIKGLQIANDDIHSAVLAQAKSYPGKEQEIVNLYMKDSKMLESLRGSILEEKAVRHIFNNEVILNEKNYTKAKLDKILIKEDDKSNLKKSRIREQEEHVHGPNCNHEHDHTHTHQYEHDHKHVQHHVPEHDRKQKRTDS